MLEDTNSLDGAHIHLGLNLYAWYHDASSSGSPVILFTRLLYYTKCQSRKRETIQPNIYRILPKFNQVICTLHTICKPDIMILAHRVRQVFCSQGPLLAKCLKGLLPPTVGKTYKLQSDATFCKNLSVTSHEWALLYFNIPPCPNITLVMLEYRICLH